MSQPTAPSPLIYSKVSAIMREMDAIGKDQKNTHQGFKFRGIDQVYNELHPRLAKHGVFSVPKVIEEIRTEKATKSGGLSFHVLMKVEYTLFAEDGSSISAIVYGEAADTGDKAATKAMAIAHKYFFLQVFAIPTEDLQDPDQSSVEFKAEPAPAQAEKPASARMINPAFAKALKAGPATEQNKTKQPAPTGARYHGASGAHNSKGASRPQPAKSETTAQQKVSDGNQAPAKRTISGKAIIAAATRAKWTNQQVGQFLQAYFNVAGSNDLEDSEVQELMSIMDNQTFNEAMSYYVRGSMEQDPAWDAI